MLVAPGNWTRLEESTKMSRLEQIKANLPWLFEYILGSKLFMLVFFVCILIVSLQIMSEVDKIKRSILFVYISVMLVVTSGLLVRQGAITEWGDMGVRIVSILLLIIGICLIGYYLMSKNMIYAFICLIGSILSYGVMAVIPSIPGRILIPCFLLMTPVLGSILVNLIIDIKGFMIYVPILILLLDNEMEIYSGYKENSSIHYNNWEAMEEASSKIKEGEEVANVELRIIPNELCTAPLGYMEAYGFADIYMRLYFDLPDSVVIEWR